MLAPVPKNPKKTWHDVPSRSREHAGLLETPWVIGAKACLRSPGASGRCALATLDDNLSTRVFAAPQVMCYPAKIAMAWVSEINPTEASGL